MTTQRQSIKKTLYLWVLPIVFLGMLISLLLSLDLLDEQAETAFDRTLVGVLQAIDVNISTPNGGLALEEPYRLLEFFQFTATGNAYYHVATEDGLAEIGYPALPKPTLNTPLENYRIYLTTGYYLNNQPVRVATLMRPMDPNNPLNTQRIVVQVAESLEGRQAFSHRLFWRNVMRDLFTFVLIIAFLAWGIFVALRPLQKMQQRLAKRSHYDLRPIDTHALPQEMVPLVQAINKQTQRVIEQNKYQGQFLHDASHQLRTPLSILKTQVNYALRETDPQESRQALLAMNHIIQRATRLTNQLLQLARAQHTADALRDFEKEPIYLITTVQQCIDWLELPALNKNIDMVFRHHLPTETPHLNGFPLLLQEALMNILDNALQYSPRNSHIYINIHAHTPTHLSSSTPSTLTITIEDEGDGMNHHDMKMAGYRFRRGESGKNLQGAGLGLAIVKTIVELHEGELQLAPSKQHGGLRVSLVFTLDFPT